MEILQLTILKTNHYFTRFRSKAKLREIKKIHTKAIFLLISSFQYEGNVCRCCLLVLCKSLNKASIAKNAQKK